MQESAALADLGKRWVPVLCHAVQICLCDVPPRLLTPPGRRVVAVKTDGDPTLETELYVEDRMAGVIGGHSRSVRLHSEERGFLLDCAAPEVVILLDPIDGTVLATRGLPGACVGISVHEVGTMRPLAAALGDYYGQDVYWACEEGAFKNGTAVKPSTVSSLAEAFVSTCYGKASRIASMLDVPGLVGTALWTETTGTMLAMARVASGQIDAYWDLMLGYKPYDLAAGAYIAQASGAVVSDEDGRPLRYPADLNQRCKFVIAANRELHHAIMRAAGRRVRRPT